MIVKELNFSDMNEGIRMNYNVHSSRNKREAYTHPERFKKRGFHITQEELEKAHGYQKPIAKRRYDNQ
jgi:hypothetical protein